MKRTLAIFLCLLLCVPSAFAEMDAIVATVGSRRITRAELDAAYEAAYGDYAADDEDLQFDLRLELVNRMMEEAVVQLKIEEQGFDEATDEEIAQTTAKAEAEYDAYVERYATMLDDGSMDREELLSYTESVLASMDMSREDYTQQAVADIAKEKLRAWATQGCQLSDEEIQKEYEAMVESDKSMFDAYPDGFISCTLYGMPYLYVPEGVRTVRQIIIGFDEDQSEEYWFVSDAIERGEAAQEDLDALYAQMDNRVREIMNQLDLGKDFAQVEAEYSDNKSALPSGTDSKIYYVCQGTTIWDSAFTDAAMALETIGQVSDPVRMSDGIHILYYEADVPAGPVALEEVKDYVAESAMYQMEAQTYREAVDGWLEEMGANIDLTALE